MSDLNLKVRECRAHDLDTVTRIEEICYGIENAMPRLAMAQHLELCGPAFVVGECGCEVVGFALGGIALGTDKELGWLLGVAVIPSLQGRFIGTVLCRHVIATLIRFGARRFRATAAPDNERSLKMLTRLKFRAVEDVADYFGPGQRRLVLELDGKDRFGA